MKKAITIALVLAVMVTLCFSTVALAAPPPEPGVHTNWEFDGIGSIQIHNETHYYGGSSYSDLYVETTGSHSSGWEDAAGGQVSRHAYVEDGIVFASTHGSVWGINDMFWAYLDTEGEGFVDQSYSFAGYWAASDNHIEADCSYEMGAGMEFYPDNDPVYGFSIGGSGDGSGVFDTRFNHVENRALTPEGFYFHGDTNVDAGFNTSWNSMAKFGVTIETRHVETHVGTYDSEGELAFFEGSGNLSSGAYSDDWVTISGFINRIK